jgi:hypothetical protein
VAGGQALRLGGVALLRDMDMAAATVEVDV